MTRVSDPIVSPYGTAPNDLAPLPSAESARRHYKVALTVVETDAKGRALSNPVGAMIRGFIEADVLAWHASTPEQVWSNHALAALIGLHKDADLAAIASEFARSKVSLKND